MVDKDLQAYLDSAVLQYNTPDFIDDDPVRFPRMFRDKRDIEIASLLVSSIAWGNRKMILRSAGKMLALLDGQPYHYVLDKGFEELPDGNIHRTFFAKDLRHYLRGLHRIYTTYGSLEDLAAAVKADEGSDFLPWRIAARVNRELLAANGCENCRCLPLGLDTSALKRFNMALRWLVRRDGIVDLGVWDVMAPSDLYIPLDVHVGNVARGLGLLTRKSNDRKAVVELTETLRTLCPDDPVRYDFALFGAGVYKSFTKD